jgi:hypothetical protein
MQVSSRDLPRPSLRLQGASCDGRGSRLIRRAVLTPANVHDLQLAVLKRLVQGDEAYVLPIAPMILANQLSS